MIRPNPRHLSQSALEKVFAAKLREWNISRKQVEARGWRLLTVEEARREFRGVLDDTLLSFGQGFVYIPYLNFDGKPITYSKKPFFQLRFLGDEPLDQRGKKVRYRQPLDSGTHLYMEPSDELLSGETDLFITEGPSKAEAARAAGFKNVLALVGVDAWRTPELDRIKLEGRNVYIVYDSDAVSNPNVTRAENALARYLVSRGAHVYIIRIPNGVGAKVGWDDFLRDEGGREGFDRLIQDAEEFSGSEALHQLNEEVRYVRDPSAVVKLVNGQVMRCATFVNEAFINRTHTVLVQQGEEIRPKEVASAKEWMKWNHRAEVERMTYAPGEDVITAKGELNRWTGWGVEAKEGDVSKWTALLDFLCKSLDADQRLWFERWLAYPIQNPGAKLYGAVVVWGSEQGTGKSLLGYTMGQLYGKNFGEINNEHLTSSFNASWAELKQFILGEEIVCGEDNKRTIYNRLKSWITQVMIKMNQKYQPVYDVPDCINYYFTTNQPDAFYLADEDRRFFIIEVRDKAMEQEFYTDFVNWRDNEGGAEAIMHYLQHLPLGDFNPKARPPDTQAKLDIVADSRTSAEKWAQALIEAPDEMLSMDAIPKDQTPQHSLYTIKRLTAFAHYHTPEEEKKFISEKTVGKALAKYKFAKVRCSKDGRLKIPGEGFPYVWIIRDAERLAKITDPNRIRDVYQKERGIKKESAS